MYPRESIGDSDDSGDELNLTKGIGDPMKTRLPPRDLQLAGLQTLHGGPSSSKPEFTLGETLGQTPPVDVSSLASNNITQARLGQATPRQPLSAITPSNSRPFVRKRPYNFKDFDYWNNLKSRRSSPSVKGTPSKLGASSAANIEQSLDLSKENSEVNVMHGTPTRPRSISTEFPPPPPRKKPVIDSPDESPAVEPLSGVRPKHLWEGEDVYWCEGLAFLDEAAEVGHVEGTEESPQLESFYDSPDLDLLPPFNFPVPLQVPDVESQPSLTPRATSTKEARKPAVRKVDVAHRPITRSMSKTRKVYVPIDNFTVEESRHLLYSDAEYAVGDLLDEYNCPETGRRMIKAQMDHCCPPKEFFWTQVMIASPDNVSAQIQYTNGCVCCLPKGETHLPSESDKSDDDYNTDVDNVPTSMVDQFLELDENWEEMTVDELASLKVVDQTFRYFDSLPFLQKYHDCHWLRDYKRGFATERSWLGEEEISRPNIARTKSPGEILDHIITLQTWTRIVRETNRYALQKQRKDWVPTTVAEMKCWIGICIFMGIKKLPNLKMYWNKSHPIFANSFISDLMPRDRWLDIMGALHLVNNETIVTDKADINYDRIIKVRWLIDALCERFRAVKPIDRYISVDEMMVRCTARMCPVKQYNKDKPTPHGVKVWALASASTRYVYALDVSCGAQSGPSQVAPAKRAPVEKNPEDRATYKVVMGLMQHVPSGHGHVVTMDNYFTSVPLFIDLLSRKIYCTGTARPGIVGWPSSMPWHKKMKADRGHLRWRMRASGEMGCCVWQDKKPVAILSTYALPWSPDTVVQRKEGANKVTYPTSPSLLSYVKLMRGVDLVDQIHGGYSTSRRGRRWYKRLVFFILDSAVCNCWVLGNEMWRGSSKEDWPFTCHLSFNIQLADDLVFAWKSYMEERKCISRTLSSGPVAHGPSRSASSSRKCSVCGVRTKWFCDTCKGMPAMCVLARGCYKIFHQRKRITM